MPDDTDPPQKEPNFFAMTVPDRKKATLIPILKYKIKENTTVWSDGWASYFTLKKYFLWLGLGQSQISLQGPPHWC